MRTKSPARCVAEMGLQNVLSASNYLKSLLPTAITRENYPACVLPTVTTSIYCNIDVELEVEGSAASVILPADSQGPFYQKERECGILLPYKGSSLQSKQLSTDTGL